MLKVNTVKAVYEQKEPYTDEEVETILEQALLCACPRLTQIVKTRFAVR